MDSPPPQAVNNLARRAANSVYAPESSSDDDYVARNYERQLRSSRAKRQATISQAIKSKAKSTRTRYSSPEYRCSDGHDEDDDVSVVNDPDLDPSILDSD